MPQIATAVAERPWAIGIYTGDSPLALSEPGTIRNPVLSRSDVSDVRASFVADPFMVRQDGRWYMFFEVKNEARSRGEIGLATSDDGLHWDYDRIVLREPFHLSYPHVFAWNDDYYMTPETLSLRCVSLYRADPFPTHWVNVGPIVPVGCADPTIFRVDDTWWLFGCTPATKHETLRLYSSRELTRSWQEHPMSPVVVQDRRIARPAGRVTIHGERILRFAQDCHARYGECVRALEVTELTPETYREREIEGDPVLGAAARDGWNSQRMHHVDPHRTADGRWIASVDGC